MVGTSTSASLHGGNQFRLRHRPVLDVQPGVEQFAHARLDRIGQLARDDDERLLFAGHYIPDTRILLRPL